MRYLTIVEDKGVWWIADECDYIDGPFKTLQLAELELGCWQDTGEDDDE